MFTRDKRGTFFETKRRFSSRQRYKILEKITTDIVLTPIYIMLYHKGRAHFLGITQWTKRKCYYRDPHFLHLFFVKRLISNRKNEILQAFISGI